MNWILFVLLGGCAWIVFELLRGLWLEYRHRNRRGGRLGKWLSYHKGVE